jgi:hypothetical protein
VSISVRAHTPGFHRRRRVITSLMSFACDWGNVTSIPVASEESFTALRSDREREHMVFFIGILSILASLIGVIELCE